MIKENPFFQVGGIAGEASASSPLQCLVSSLVVLILGEVLPCLGKLPGLPAHSMSPLGLVV